jgi:prevent-host-death family protein
MKEIPISRFKATCLAVLEEVRKSGVPVRVTRFGKPVADVTPPAAMQDRSSQIGSLRGTMTFPDELVEAPAVPDDAWEALRK